MSTGEVIKFRPSDQDKADAKAKHRRVFVVEAKVKDEDDAGDDVKLVYEVLCRQPKRVEWQRYINVSAADRGKAQGALITIFTQCLVWPTLKELAPEFDDLPPLETMLAGIFLATVEEAFEGEGKKLGSGST
jgi:hypothetical protein